MANPFISFLQLFRNFSEEEQAFIEAALEYRTYKENDYLFKANKICKEFFFICKGVLRIMVINDKGKEVTYFFLKENQFCSILHSFNNQVVASESIQAACDAEVIVLKKHDLEKLYGQIPHLKGLIDQIVQQGLLDKIQLRNGYLGEDSTTRYKLFMMRQPEVALRVQQSDIASYLGITPQSLSRIRKKIS